MFDLTGTFELDDPQFIDRHRKFVEIWQGVFDKESGQLPENKDFSLAKMTTDVIMVRIVEATPSGQVIFRVAGSAVEKLMNKNNPEYDTEDHLAPDLINLVHFASTNASISKVAILYRFKVMYADRRIETTDSLLFPIKGSSEHNHYTIGHTLSTDTEYNYDNDVDDVDQVTLISTPEIYHCPL